MDSSLAEAQKVTNPCVRHVCCSQLSSAFPNHLQVRWVLKYLWYLWFHNAIDPYAHTRQKWSSYAWGVWPNLKQKLGLSSLFAGAIFLGLHNATIRRPTGPRNRT